MGRDFGGKGGEMSFGETRANDLPPGENGGVGVVLSGNRLEWFESGRAGPFDDGKDNAAGEDSVNGTLLDAASGDCKLRPLLGVDLVTVRRLERGVPLLGKTKSDGLTLSIASCQGLPLIETALSSPDLPSLPFLLSLLLSRMPFALEFRTAGLRKS